MAPITKAIGKILKPIRKGTFALADPIADATTAILSPIGSAAGTAIKAGVGTSMDTVSTIGKTVTDVGAPILDVGMKAADPVLDVVEKAGKAVVDPVGDVVSDVVPAVVKGTLDLAGDTLETVGSIPGAAVEAVEDLGKAIAPSAPVAATPAGPKIEPKEAVRAEESIMRRRRRGRKQTIATSVKGVTGGAPVARKTLLGG